MKASIHPQLFDVNVHCACGNEFLTRSTKQEMRVEVCSACHSFFTGKHKIMDTAGRVEKFNRKYTKKAVTEEVVPVVASSDTEIAAMPSPIVNAQ
jgi:large subunit ribosomal protein L31